MKESFLLTTLNAKYIHVNLAIRLLYQLNKHDERLQWKEFTIKEDKDELAELCSDFSVVCFSCYIWNIVPTLELAKKLKRLNPQIKILLGGPEVSYDNGELITLPEVDYIISGEGEIPFSNFLKCYPFIENVPQLAYKKENQVYKNFGSTQFDLRLYENIMPYENDDPLTLPDRVLYIETSRGCPYKCEFCLASTDNNVRYLPDAHIKNTLLYLIQNGKVIKFLDRTFNIKKNFTLDIFTFILNHYRDGNVFQFEITADILHPEIIQFIQEKMPKNLLRFEIGIQTINQVANLDVKRKQNFEKTKQIIYSVKDKVELHLDLIVGLPYDYWNDVKQSIESVFKLYPPELQLGFLKFLKGTPMPDKAKEHEYLYDKNPPYQIFSSKYLSEEELNKIARLEHVLEIYWNKKRAVLSLTYISENYGVFDFLLGLGEYFASYGESHRYTLNQVYERISGFAVNHFKEDQHITELIALDYYMHYKVKPKALFPIEIDHKERNSLINELKLNHHQYRYVALRISFDFKLYIQQNIFKKGNFVVIIRYDGKEKATLENCVSLKQTSIQIPS